MIYEGHQVSFNSTMRKNVADFKAHLVGDTSFPEVVDALEQRISDTPLLECAFNLMVLRYQLLSILDSGSFY